MNKIFESTDISFFKVNNGKLYFKNSKGIWIWGAKHELLFDDKNSSNMLFNFDNFIVLDNLNNPIYYSNGLFDKLKQVSNIRISKIIDNYVVYYIKKPRYICGLFDLKTEDFFEFDKNYFEYYFQPNFYSTLEKKITCLRINPLPLWQYTLPEGEYDWQRRTVYINTPYEEVKAEIEKIIGVHQKTLYLLLNSGLIIGLDVKTGIEKTNKLKPDFFPENHDLENTTSTIFGGPGTQLDEQNGVIFGIFNTFYGEYNLNTQQYAMYDIAETLKENNIKYTDWGCWQGDEIFFGETDFADRPARVGIFNRQTRQITWTSRELGEEGIFKGIQKIEYQGNRLYVLDRASTLHIFER